MIVHDWIEHNNEHSEEFTASIKEIDFMTNSIVREKRQSK